jgi:hypothetical protein
MPEHAPTIAADRPTKAKLLKELRSHIDLDVIDEADVVDLFASEQSAYYYLGRPGTIIPLKIVGRSGRVQVESKMVIKTIAADGIVLRYEGAGKVQVTEA